MTVHALAVPQRPVVTERRLAVVAALSVITLGFYTWFWYYWINREMREFGRASGDARLAESRPARSVWAITLGSLVVVPAVISLVRATGRIQSCERAATGQAPGTGLLATLIAVTSAAGVAGNVATGTVFVVAALVASTAWVLLIVLMQRRLNRAWHDLPPR